MFSRQFPRFRRCCETSTRQKHYFSILGRSTSAQLHIQPAKREQSQLRQLAIPYVRWFHASATLRSDIVEVEGPAFAESISEGDIRWAKQKGDFVNADELVAEIETDKTSVEVPAPFSGTIVELLVPDGEKVVAKQKLYKLQKGEGGGSSESSSGSSSGSSSKSEKVEKEDKPEPKKEEKPAPKKEEKPAPPRSQQQSHSAPPKQPESKPKPAEGEKSGPIPKHLPQVPQPPSKPLSSKPVEDIPLSVPGLRAPSDGKNPITGDRTETRVKMNRMRQRIAQRLKEAQNTNAMLTTFNEVDMTNIMSLRKKYQDAFVKKYGIKFGLMSPFVRAAALALQDQPVVNAVIEDEEIVYRNYVDISVAVASPKGLLVPVLRNVESQGYASIEKTLAALGAKARDGKIAIEDMQGGTFTISNGGVFGSLFGTPIINPPQSAILGMHSIVERPVAVNGEVKIRPMMYVALTYDHRLIDGREAVLFLRKIKEGVEDPATILLDL